MEALVTRPESSQVIHSLLSSPPGKFLELGVNALLADRCFRGSGARKRAWYELGDEPAGRGPPGKVVRFSPKTDIPVIEDGADLWTS